jgi:hypothetical protein
MMQKHRRVVTVLCILGILAAGCRPAIIRNVIKLIGREAEQSRQEKLDVEFASIKLALVQRMQMTTAPSDVRSDVTYEDFEATLQAIPEATREMLGHQAIEILGQIRDVTRTAEAQE